MIQTVKRLLSYLKYEKAIFVKGILLSFATTGLGLYAPLVAKQMIDQVITPAATKGVLNISQLFFYIGFYLLLNTLTSLTGYGGRMTLKRLSNILVKRMRDEVFEHVQTLPIRYFDNLPAGKVVSRITSDTEAIRSQFYESAISTVLMNTLKLVGVYVMIIWLNPKLGILLLGLIPLLVLWQMVYSAKAGKFSKMLRELLSDMNGQINETVQGMSIIQAFQQERRLLTEFSKKSDEWQEQGRRYILLDAFASWGLLEFLQNLVLATTIVFIGMQFLDGSSVMTAGTIFAFIDYINRLFEPLQAFMQVVSGIQQSLAAGTRVLELLDEPSEYSKDQEFTMEEGNVVFEHVCFGYKEDQLVLHDISFDVHAGETIAFVGHTGSGKSSLLNVLFRFYDPVSGTITIDGKNIAEYSRKSVRKEMAIVLQDPYLFTGTIASNIRLDKSEISDQDIEEALRKVGAEQLLTKTTQGIHTPVTEKGQEFSSGERQLISFARALAHNPKLLILDEATSHVDTETEAIIQHAMEVLEEGRTTFIIAHRLSTIKHANQIIVLDKGRIIERGTHKDLLEQNGTYAMMYEMQAKSLKVEG